MKILPDVYKRWQASPLKQNPSSSNSDSITNGGAKAVTTRNTDLGFADKPIFKYLFYRERNKYAKKKKVIPETTMSPPGQTIVSNCTLVPDTKPTRRHFVLPAILFLFL